MGLDVTTYAGPSTELEQAVAALEARGFHFEAPETEIRTVLDTFDGRLAAESLRLERRDGGRRELVLDGADVVAAHIPLDRAVRVAADLPPGPFRARLTSIIDVRALTPQLTVSARLRRGEWRDGTGKVVATVALRDDLRSDPAAGEPALPAVTLEVAGLVGYDKRNRQTVDVVEQAGWRRLDGDTITVAADIAGVDLRGFDASPTVPLDPRAPAIDGVRAVLANLLTSIEANWQGTVDAVDPEFLHDLRVAVRRSRSVLGESKHVLPTSIGAEARERFKTLGRATGPACDLDVYVIEWPTYTAGLDASTRQALQPALELLCRHRDEAQHELVRLLDAAQAEGWIDRWRSWLHGPVTDPDQGRDQHRPLGDHVAQRIDKAHDLLVVHGRRIGPDSPAEALHDLRKDAKRLRYLLECFGSTLPDKSRDRFVKRLKALQTNLGEHQDAEVHVHHLREVSHELHDGGASPVTLMAIGQLAEQLDRRRHATRVEFAEQFDAFDDAKTRKALRAMLDGIAR